MDKSPLTDQIKFTDHMGLLHLQTKFGMKWAGQCEANLSYEEVFQEASVALCLAINGYKRESGVTFSAYYTKVAFSQFRTAIALSNGAVKNLTDKQRGEIKARREENALLRKEGKRTLPEKYYGLSCTYFDDITSDAESGDSFEQSIPSDMSTPEEIVEFRQELDYEMKRLSPMAKVMVEWLKDPPPELTAEIQKCQAFARATNTTSLLDTEVSLDSVSKFMQLVVGVTARETYKLRRELLDMIQRIEGGNYDERKCA